jgi:hypothetical protein
MAGPYIEETTLSIRGNDYVYHVTIDGTGELFTFGPMARRWPPLHNFKAGGPFERTSSQQRACPEPIEAI